jgi:hypothetical protein
MLILVVMAAFFATFFEILHGFLATSIFDFFENLGSKRENVFSSALF